MKFCLKQKLEEIKFWTTFILGSFRVSIWNFKFWAVKIELKFCWIIFSLYSLFFPLPRSVCRRSSCSSPPGCLPMPSSARSSLRRPHPYPKPAACSLPRLPGSAPFLLPIAPTDRARAAQCQPAKSVGHTSSLSDSARPSLPHPFLSSLRLEFHISWPLGTSWQLPVTLLVNSIFPATRGTTTYACVSSTPVPAAQDAPTRWLLHVLVLLPSTSVGNRSISFLSLCSCSCD